MNQLENSIIFFLDIISLFHSNISRGPKIMKLSPKIIKFRLNIMNIFNLYFSLEFIGQKFTFQYDLLLLNIVPQIVTPYLCQ
jgi:hypothetical protein